MKSATDHDLVATPVLIGGRSVLVLDLAANISGSHKLFTAMAIVRAAVRDGNWHVAAGSCGNYGLAVALAAHKAGVAVTVTLPAGWGDEGAAIRGVGGYVNLVEGGYETAVAVSKQEATRHGVADVNIDGPYAAYGIAALSRAIEPIAGIVAEPPATIWLPLGNGTTLVALRTAMSVLGWPTSLVGVSSAGNNSILASWPSLTHVDLKPHTVHPTAANEPLVNWSAMHGPEALVALHATGGAALGVDDHMLLAARDLLIDHDVPATPAGAAGVAGLLATDQIAQKRGVQVALVTGRS